MAPASPTILITGASGFIGGHLARRLVAGGAEVHGVSRQEHEVRADGVRWWRGDLTDADALPNLVAAVAPQVIVHLASQVSGARGPDNVLPTFRNNLLTSVAVMLAAVRTGIRRIVIAGSMDEPAAGETNQVPGSPYAAAKWAASGYARMFRALYDLDIVSLRIAMVYGPGQADTTKLVPYAIRSLLRGVAPELGSGNRAVDWVYVEDVARGIERACFAAQAEGQTLDLASGNLVSIREVVERLTALANPSVVPKFGAIADRPLERAWSADVARTKALLGWRATTSLDLGLAQTVRWYRDHV